MKGEKKYTAVYKNGKIKEITAKNKVVANAIARIHQANYGCYELTPDVK